MTLKAISPIEAKRLIDRGAIMIDIREKDEYAREHVPGARNIALSKLDEADLSAYQGQTVVFHCRSGGRTASNGARLADIARDRCEAFIVDGGLDAWRKTGFPTNIDRRHPIDIQRQVQIGAGALILLGLGLGLEVSPLFFAIPLFVGAGLTFAGMTGFCGMAKLLQRAPWNRIAAAEVV